MSVLSGLFSKFKADPKSEPEDLNDPIAENGPEEDGEDLDDPVEEVGPEEDNSQGEDLDDPTDETGPDEGSSLNDAKKILDCILG